MPFPTKRCGGRFFILINSVGASMFKEMLIFFAIIFLICGNALGENETMAPTEKGQKAWVLSDETPLTNEPSYVSESIILINRGQAVKILEINGEWAKIQLLKNEPGWKYDGKKWVEANEAKYLTTAGWLTRSLLSIKKPPKPIDKPIETKGYSPYIDPNRKQ